MIHVMTMKPEQNLFKEKVGESRSIYIFLKKKNPRRKDFDPNHIQACYLLALDAYNYGSDYHLLITN